MSKIVPANKYTSCWTIPIFWNRTTLVIAHRLSTIKNAKRICVLSNEGIVEEGTHEELLKKNGQYAGFYNLGKNLT